MRGSHAGAICLLMLAAPVGCGSKYVTHPVEGKVQLADGTPLPGVQLVWESADPPMSATAITDAQGRYQLSTLRPGDGVPLGQYRVVAVAAEGDDPDAPIPQRFHAKYASFETTDLSFTVEKGANRLDITLDAPE